MTRVFAIKNSALISAAFEFKYIIHISVRAVFTIITGRETTQYRLRP